MLFRSVDRLKEVCEELKKDVENGFKNVGVVDLLEECQELIEIHERNCLNLCLLGGLESLMKYITSHPDAEARIIACQTFNQVVQNNEEVQNIAHKLHAFNLMNLFVAQTDIKNKEALFGALSSFIRGVN